MANHKALLEFVSDDDHEWLRKLIKNYQSLNTNFAKTLKSIRKSRGETGKADLTQEKIAAQIGVSPSTFSRWENGIAKPQSLNEVSNLIEALGCTEAEGATLYMTFEFESIVERLNGHPLG